MKGSRMKILDTDDILMTGFDIVCKLFLLFRWILDRQEW